MVIRDLGHAPQFVALNQVAERDRQVTPKRSVMIASGCEVSQPTSISADDSSAAGLLARLERLPVSRIVTWARMVVGMATFFDGYTTLAIAYALPILSKTWHLTPAAMGMIIASGYFGQLLGAVFFGWLAERIGRLPVMAITIAIFGAMSLACIFSWDAQSLMIFRFVQGVGSGGEIPVASAYVNEFVGARNRGRFFLLYELLFVIGLLFSGVVGYELVPIYGWKAMFMVGVVPVFLTIPLRFTLPESPRWLVGHGKLQKAAKVIVRLEQSLIRRGIELPAPVAIAIPAGASLAVKAKVGAWRELFGRAYGGRTTMLWALWFGAYMVNNGLVTWLPTLYRTLFNVPLKVSLAYGLKMSCVGVVTCLICALTIDRVGRRRWYICAFFLAVVPLSILWWKGASSATVIFALATCAYATLQTVAFSLFLYSAELYPTRLRSVGAGLGSAWLRAGSMAGPAAIGLIVGTGHIALVFALFAVVSASSGLVCLLWAPETSGRVLEEMSP